LQADQYGRGVAQVYTDGFLFRHQHVDKIMLRAGLAKVYQGSGAVYGPKGKESYLQLQNMAAAAKVGMWSQKKRKSAAEYKRRTKY
jgi:endonuclease YncB( thermonuclease family)